MSKPFPTPQTEVPCDWCGEVFLPTPDSFVEGGFVAGDEPDPADAWKGEQEPQPTGIQSNDLAPADRQAIQAQLGINEAQLEELLTTGVLGDVYSCICPKCLEGNDE